jgi:hypothetical protein
MQHEIHEDSEHFHEAGFPMNESCIVTDIAAPAGPARARQFAAGGLYLKPDARVGGLPVPDFDNP